MKETLFISHATPTDNIFATWLATKLELCGYKVWVDVNNLSPSVDLWNTIDNTIRNEAIRFIFVASKSSVDPSRDGVQKELAVADKVKRQCPNFIIPVRIDDVSFSDFPVELIRLNAIDFCDNWANGLKLLLKHLEDEKIPKPATNSESQYYVNRWSESQTPIRSQVTDDEDQYCSNLHAIDLPPQIYIYPADPIEQILKEKHIPHKKNKRILITFACNKCVNEWTGQEIEFECLQTEDAISNHTAPGVYMGERVANLSHDIVSILNWSIGEMMFNHRLRRYKAITGKRSRNVYFFPSGSKAKNVKTGRPKYLAGTYKTHKQWHFGLSGYYTQYPISGVIFKWHLIFTDNNGMTIPDSFQVSARRSKGKLFFNKQWKELLQASMVFLSDGSSNIYHTSCCEENAMYIRSQSERFVSEKSYFEPQIYKQEKNEADE